METEYRYKNYYAKLGFDKTSLGNFIVSKDQDAVFNILKESINNNGDWFSIFHKDELLMFGGYTHYWNGRCALWTVYSNNMNLRHWFFVYDIAEKYINYLRSIGYNRIESSADASNNKFCVWLDKLGFTKEGLMRRYGIMGEDCYLYSRVYK